jgi:hypothetical protein
MANEPTSVDLLDGNGHHLLTVTGSQKPSMNDEGSEKTRSVVIHGPLNCVVTCFDDSEWNMDEKSVVIIKKVANDLTVPIATDFVSGELPEGVYRGNGLGYFWQLNKAVKSNFFDDVWNAIEWIGNHVDIGTGDPNPNDPGNDPGTLSQGLSGNPNMQPVPNLPPGVVGYTFDGANSSSNNHVDNMSSIKFGDS